MFQKTSMLLAAGALLISPHYGAYNASPGLLLLAYGERLRGGLEPRALAAERHPRSQSPE